MLILNTYKKYYVQQVDENDCGVAALAMILKRYSSDYSLAYLRNLAKTNLEGTTALGLIKTAESLNFATKAIQANMSLFDIKDLPLPFIAHVKKKNGLLHYYVVFNSKKNYLIVGDPDPEIGLIKMSKQQFKKEWSGIALFFAPNPSYHPEKQGKHGLGKLIMGLLKHKRLIINTVLAALLVTIISIAGYTGVI